MPPATHTHGRLAVVAAQHLRMEVQSQRKRRRELLVAAAAAFGALVEWERHHGGEPGALALEVERHLQHLAG